MLSTYSSSGEAVIPGDARFREVYEFLLQEADLLDTDRFREWLDLLTEDISYRVPLRLNTRHYSGEQDYSSTSELLTENLSSLTMRVNKMGTEYAWAETPASRTRHFISNVRARAGDRADEMRVSSYLLLYRNQGSDSRADIFSGVRHDVLRQVDGVWRLAERTVLLDQAVLDGIHLGIIF
ncbi:MAG TPA: 3-phenylpropionate/cinnamic acid dioxygenase subunit beta [Chloroflexota bacterium]|nr:3-phenylpropionate/cinnamic acid dioxygenase subunit beta [Chloroflexota bacterium]